MGWSYGVTPEGREVGYSVAAVCDDPDCNEEIDRGLSYLCGSMHGGDELSCGGYFCPKHLVIGGPSQLCFDCYDSFTREHPNYGEQADPDDEHTAGCELCLAEQEHNARIVANLLSW